MLPEKGRGPKALHRVTRSLMRLIMPMPIPRLDHRAMRRIFVCVAGVFALAGMAALLPQTASAQISTVTNTDGRRMFVNAEPPTLVRVDGLKTSQTKVPK